MAEADDDDDDDDDDDAAMTLDEFAVDGDRDSDSGGSV
jgi:hypothetical protein